MQSNVFLAMVSLPKKLEGRGTLVPNQEANEWGSQLQAELKNASRLNWRALLDARNLQLHSAAPNSITEGVGMSIRKNVVCTDSYLPESHTYRLSASFNSLTISAWLPSFDSLTMPVLAA